MLVGNGGDGAHGRGGVIVAVVMGVVVAAA